MSGITPKVSVIVANHNGAAHLEAALRSILAQTLTQLEVIVVDDASTDGSVPLLQDLAREDGRLRFFERKRRGGPAAARNDALVLARGTWIAIVDGDDFLARDRLARLIAAAEADGAEIAADDMVAFHEDGTLSPRRFLSGPLAKAAGWIDPVTYITANALTGRRVPLGYLKPVIRREAITRSGVAYDEQLRIAEDYDLVLRLLLAGCRMRVYPTIGYFYRRHNASISHRLPDGALAAMVAADDRLRLWAGKRLTPAITDALDARIVSIQDISTVEAAMLALKSRDLRQFIWLLRNRPSALGPWLGLAGKAVKGRLRRRQPQTDASPVIRVISRQRITPDGNGSSAYLLCLCRALREAGFALHLISPTPGTFGRMPAMRVDALDEIFARMDFRGGSRIGGWLLARDPAIYLAAALGITAKALLRLKLPAPATWQRPAPYAMALPWTAEDLLFVARHSQGSTDAVIADYAFCLPAAPFAIAPLRPTAVIMHDLLSARAENFRTVGARDSVALLDEAAEADMLRRADLVVAIQAQEGEVVRRMVTGGTGVVVAPMATMTVTAPQPGEGGGLLFVGSGTAPNVDGLRWFLKEVWPLITDSRPDASLSVAGLVCGRLTEEAQQRGVVLLGRVPDLAGLYRKADVVISPLRAGSGLKIKLIEALAAGKAVVASPVTLQGVEHLLEGAVARADAPAEFAAAVLNLLEDATRREALAQAALSAAQAHFSPESAALPFVAALRERMSQATARPRELAQ